MKLKIIITFISIFISLLGCTKKVVKPDVSDKLLLGAYYYLWYPENFSIGCLRKELIPKQPPMLNWYHSNDKSVIEQHIKWCKDFGVDFLAVSFWPFEDKQNSILTNEFMNASNIKDIKFCIFYETWRLGFDKKTGKTTFTDNVTQKFLSDMDNIQKTYFNHPSYLKVDNKPVIIFYLTRTFCGEYDEAIKNFRKNCKKNGFDIFIIGDEIFWEVVPSSNSIFNYKSNKTRVPQKKRIKIFDAITCYNMYENGLPKHKGYGSSSQFFKDVKSLWSKYKKVCGDDLYFVPNAIPGYNDRGVRPRENHFAIPRLLDSRNEEGSFFNHFLNELTIPFLDSKLKMALITSFNEWNEDTQIEPAKITEKTRIGKGKPNNYFSDNYEYKGYGFTYLEVIKKIKNLK